MSAYVSWGRNEPFDPGFCPLKTQRIVPFNPFQGGMSVPL